MQETGKLVHYGKLNRGVLLDTDFGGKREQHSFNKPRFPHTLWTSPQGSGYGWAEWCADEKFDNFDGIGGRAWWTLELTLKARILTIDTLSDLERIVGAYRCTACPPGRYPLTDIDWCALADDYDAIHLTEKGQWRTRLETPDLYGWDCESVVLFRASATAAIVGYRSINAGAAAAEIAEPR